MNDEDHVRQRRDAWKQAFEAGDVDGIMTFYAPELQSYDIMPPLQFVGLDQWRRNWESFFGQFAGDQKLEFADLAILCSGDLAVVRGLTRLLGTMGGQPIDVWTRETNILKRIDGAWMVVHDHVSVPVDFATARPCMDLKP